MNSHYTAVPYSEDDNENSNDDGASELLLPPASSPSHKVHNIAAPLSTRRKTDSHNINNNNKYHVQVKLSPLAQIKTKMLGYNSEKLRRWLNIGAILFALLFIIYLCFSMNLNFDKQTAQIVVDIPPVDASIAGPKENTQIEHNSDQYPQKVIRFSPITTHPSTNISHIPTKTTNHILRHVTTDFWRNVTHHTVPDEFLVWNPGCQMPKMDPLAKDVMKLFHREKYETCSKNEPLTSIKMNWKTSVATLVFNKKLEWFTTSAKATCCYSEIIRSGSGKNADNSFKLSSCIEFVKTFELPTHVEFILVKCQLPGKVVYKNTHAIVREKPHLRQRLNALKARSNHSLSVLMLSIDSISRLNLIRAMPKTAQHLYDTGWFELQGYNKVDDNTYPNLMAILTGYNNSLAYDECKPRAVGQLEKCPFIWQDFKDNGYVTSYGEDEASISSFNFHKSGFQTQPTDYYMRPYMLAAEKHLPIKRKHSLAFCLGYKHSADHIYDFALDFATQYKDDPSFGLYWTNTFSHNDISDPSSMDDKMRRYLDALETRNILNTSMVIFFSDHGIRFGPVRHLITGWVEERLPFIFIWLPPWFRDQHPDIVQALKINRNRLTNPYDLHMTLKHVLQLSNPDRELLPATSCANCQSLFYEVPWNRSCEDCAIADHWCTCTPYKPQDKNDKLVIKSVQYVIDSLNSQLKPYTHDDSKHLLCAKLTLKTISYTRRAENSDVIDPYNVHIIVFQLAPSNGWFEATVRYRYERKVFELGGAVSRLDTYASQSKCMKRDDLRKYCYCTDNSNTKKKRK